MTICAKCGRECPRDARHGIMQWCAKCPPSQERSRFDAYTVGSKTDWAGGKVKTDGAHDSDAFDDAREGGVADLNDSLTGAL